MRQLGLFLGVWGWGQVWIGTGFSAQQGLTGKDTAFRLTGPSRLLWVEYKAPSRLPWDTLWIVLRTPDRVRGAYSLYRTRTNPLLYRGQIQTRMASIYLAVIIPPREYRQALAQKRFYITDSAHPTIVSLRTKAQQQAASSSPITLDEVTVEHIELSTDALLSVPEQLPGSKADEPLLEEESLNIEMPEIEIPEPEDEPLELEELEDLEDL